MDANSRINGLQHSIAEIDHEIRMATPATRRNMYRGEAWAVIDNLLDQRNELSGKIGELVLDEMESYDGQN